MLVFKKKLKTKKRNKTSLFGIRFNSKITFKLEFHVQGSSDLIKKNTKPHVNAIQIKSNKLVSDNRLFYLFIYTNLEIKKRFVKIRFS